MESPEPYVTRLELAAALGISVRSVDRLVSAGLPSERWGLRTRRFQISHVLAWLEQRESGSSPQEDLLERASEPDRCAELSESTDATGATGAANMAAPVNVLDDATTAANIAVPVNLLDDAARSGTEALEILERLIDEAGRWPCQCGVCAYVRRFEVSVVPLGGDQ